MNKKNRVCLVLALFISLSNVVMASDDVIDNGENNVQIQEDKDIKANRETFEKAQEYIANKDFESAILYLTVYINSKPKKYEGYKLRGECYYELRQYALAQKDFEIAVKLKTDDDKFITNTKVISAVVLGADKSEQYQNPELGKLYADLMYAQKAQNDMSYENSYQKAGEYNSHLYLPQINKNEITKINCPQKYGKKVNTKGIDTYIYGAIDDIAAKNYNEAIYKTQNITQEYPKYFLGYYLTGVALVGLEQEKEAISAFETALKYNPYDFESMASLGQIYYTDAEKVFSADLAQKSIEYFKKALTLNPNSNTYNYYIGLNYLQIGDIDNAISSFNSAIKIKSNDYNSMYYKAIAQYLKADYEAVVEITNKLLYRHVSNYNSVLYLKALAEYKLGQDELALADVEKIQNNMNDIYNEDLKELSPKEKTLESYLYYLKANITKDSGFGAKADYDKAYQNSIIKKLAKQEKDFVLTQDDIENQYDYIRTTFDDLDLKFVYNNSEYKIVSKDSEEFSKSLNLEGSEDKNLALFTSAKEEKTSEQTINLKNSTPQKDTLVDENQNSIAKMLATGDLPVVIHSKPIEEEPIERIDLSKNTEIQKIEEQPQTVKVEDVKEFTIKYPEQETPVIEVIEKENNVETAQQEKEQQSEKENVPKIVEKYAKVDLSEFNIQQTEPEIKETDEVIVFEPTNFISRAEQKLSESMLTKQETQKEEEDNVRQIPEIRPMAIIDSDENKVYEEMQKTNVLPTTEIEKSVDETITTNPMTEEIITQTLVIPVDEVKKVQENVENSTSTNIKPVENVEEEIKTEENISKVEDTENEKEEFVEENTTIEQETVQPEIKTKKEKKTKVKKEKTKEIIVEEEQTEVEIPAKVESTVTEEPAIEEQQVQEPEIDLSPAITYIKDVKKERKFKFKNLFRRNTKKSSD